MKWGRAILTGILLWVLIFFEVTILMFGFNLARTNITYYIIHYIALIFLVLLCSLIYFRKAGGGVKEGVLLGLIFIVIGTILDLVITVPFFTGFAIYDIYLFVGYLEALVLTILFSLFLGQEITPPSTGSFKQAPGMHPSLEDLKRQVTKIPKSLKSYKTIPEIEMPAKVSKVMFSVAKKTKKKKRR